METFQTDGDLSQQPPQFPKVGTLNWQESISLSRRSSEWERPFPSTSEATAQAGAQGVCEITRCCCSSPVSVSRQTIQYVGSTLPRDMKMPSIDFVNILLCGKNSIRQSGVSLTHGIARMQQARAKKAASCFIVPCANPSEQQQFTFPALPPSATGVR